LTKKYIIRIGVGDDIHQIKAQEMVKK